MTEELALAESAELAVVDFQRNCSRLVEAYSEILVRTLDIDKLLAALGEAESVEVRQEAEAGWIDQEQLLLPS